MGAGIGVAALSAEAGIGLAAGAVVGGAVLAGYGVVRGVQIASTEGIGAIPDHMKDAYEGAKQSAGEYSTQHRPFIEARRGKKPMMQLPDSKIWVAECCRWWLQA